MIRDASEADAQAIAEIYNYYIENTVVTFEETPVNAQELAERINETQSIGLPWLVAQADDAVVGYAYASKWKGRCAYRFAVEVTVYLHHEASGCGWGSRLYERLFAELRAKQYHVAMGGISLPNPASIALHEKFGMKKVAHFEEVGFKFDDWVDVGYWQGILDHE